jgi:nitrate reductase gamma subunit
MGIQGVLTEIRMYIGGILGTIIIIALIVWFVRRV